MNTQKVAITIPREILLMIDKISQSKGISRSKLITAMLEQKLSDEKATYLKSAYDLERPFLKYTNIAALLDILLNKRIFLLDPKLWEDRNDSYYISI